MSVRVSGLPNGIIVATENIEGIDSVAADIWIHAGSRNELKEEHGLAHLLEHMAFKGTSSRSAFDIASGIENVGGTINAATGAETTSFHARTLSNDLPIAIDILADILQDSIFDSKDLEREQHVILQEIGTAHDTPDNLAFTRFMETAFPDQALGRSILGSPEIVQSFTSKQLHSFMKREYSAERVVIVAAGKVDHESFTKQVETKFRGFLSNNNSHHISPACYSGGDFRESRQLMDAQILLGFQGKAYNSRHYHSTQILSSILGGNSSSRLFQEIRENHGLCYSIYSFHWGFSDSGLFGIHAAACETDLEKLIPLIVKQLKELCDNIGNDEVNRAKAQYRAGLIMSAEDVETRASQIARQLLFFGRPIPRCELIENLEAITSKDLSALSQDIFSSPLALTAIGPLSTLPSYKKIFNSLSGNPVLEESFV